MEPKKSYPRLLLHVCCAPCATYPLSVLLESSFTHLISEATENKNYAVTAYFYDPNIHPRAEYEKRLNEARKYFAGKCELIEEIYDDARWFEATKGHERDPERGERCRICYRMRLEKTAQYAHEKGYDLFTTVLSVSPHKDALAINQIGAELAEKYGIAFLPADWKKNGGFTKSVEMSREAKLERQNYCGCVYSKKSESAVS